MAFQYNLSSFAGVDPTGATDTTSAIQTAINTVAGYSGGGDILVDGCYLVNNGGLDLASSVNLLGNGSGSSIFKARSQVYSTSSIIDANNIGNFVIKGISFDYTAATLSGSPQIIGTYNAHDFEIEDNDIFGQFILAIGCNKVTDFKIRYNKINLTTALNTQNQGINVSTQGGSTYDGVIDDNKLIKTGMIFSGTNSKIRGNNISDWKFGGGITTESGSASNLLIADNLIRDGVGMDVNNTIVCGIENWAERSIMSRNTIYGCDGDGISSGGQNCVIMENSIFANGKYGDTYCAGIKTRHVNGTKNGSNCNIVSNQSFDPAGGSGTQKYSYADENSSPYNVVLTSNTFIPYKTAATRVLGSTYVNANNKT